MDFSRDPGLVNALPLLTPPRPMRTRYPSSAFPRGQIASDDNIVADGHCCDTRSDGDLMSAKTGPRVELNSAPKLDTRT
jgi:hypothetical protein